MQVMISSSVSNKKGNVSQTSTLYKLLREGITTIADVNFSTELRAIVNKTIIL